MKMHLLVISVLAVCLWSCNHPSTEQTDSIVKYDEAWRPQFHFSPKGNWMNDPNGMVYWDGEYHLFYQYYPDGNVWGPMHWGHAVSTDMIYWEHLPIALYPDSLGYIFSGSAVIDHKNTSGLGSEDQPAMVAIYSYHDMEAEQAGAIEYQTQGIAYSVDRGRTWVKYDQNPVLPNPGIKDFRDPKVFWHDESQQWIMALAVLDKISFYGSPNLLNWDLLSSFNPPWASYGGVWECPDLFSLQSPDGETHWVLLVSINPGGPLRGSATQYFIGTFDGKNFSTTQEGIAWLDHGPDNYAGVTWSNIPVSDGRRLFIGWMSNWLYGQTVPTTQWRSAMTVPRELSLYHKGQDFQVASIPVKELERLRSNQESITSFPHPLQSDAQEIILEELKDADFSIQLSNDQGEVFLFSRTGDVLEIDRTRSGVIDFSTDFPAKHRVSVAHTPLNQVRLFIDRASIEIFLNNGEQVLTYLVFPNSYYNSLAVDGIAPKGDVYTLKSIWKQQ